ncbi:MAG: hypothetical protein Q8Q12_10600 [bacterium]|nr:hypothetical protein [bacterium]
MAEKRRKFSSEEKSQIVRRRDRRFWDGLVKLTLGAVLMVGIPTVAIASQSQAGDDVPP